MTQKFLTAFFASLVFTFPQVSWGDHYIQNFSMNANQQKTEMALDQFTLDKPNQVLRLMSLRGECHSGPEKNLFENCTQTAAISMETFEYDVRLDGLFSKSDEQKISDIAEEMPQVAGTGKFWKFRFSNFDLTVKETAYRFEFTKEKWPRINVESDGDVSYDPTKRHLKFKVKRISFGIFNVTKAVFAFVKLLELPKAVKVSYPNVEVDL